MVWKPAFELYCTKHSVPEWNTHRHGALMTCPGRDVPPLPHFLSLKKRHHGKKWELQLQNRRAETHVCDATALLPLPPCERAPAQISQLTGFNELLQPVHHTRWWWGGPLHTPQSDDNTTETSAAGPHQHQHVMIGLNCYFRHISDLAYAQCERGSNKGRLRCAGMQRESQSVILEEIIAVTNLGCIKK